MKKWTLLENFAKILALHASAGAAMNKILEELYLSAAKPSSLVGINRLSKEVSQEEGDRNQYQ